jgi:hypothetical protein
MYIVRNQHSHEIVCVASRREDVECYTSPDVNGVSYTIEQIGDAESNTVQTYSENHCTDIQ